MAYTKPWWIPFRLRLEVVRNFITALPTALGQAALDVAAALGYAVQGGLGLAGISASSLSSIDNGLAAVSKTLSLTGLSLGQNVAILNASTDPKTGAKAIQNVVGNAGALAGLVSMHSYLGRAAVTLAGGILG